MARNRVSNKEATQIYLMMKPHCSTVDGLAVYEEGWDDDRLVVMASTAFERPVSRHSVANIRKDHFGDTRPRRPTAPPNELLAEFEAIHARLEKMEAGLAELQGRFASLSFDLASVEKWASRKNFRKPTTPPFVHVNGVGLLGDKP